MDPAELPNGLLADRLSELAYNAPPGVTGQEKAQIREAARRLRATPPQQGEDDGE